MTAKYVELERVKAIVRTFSNPTVSLNIIMTLEGCPDYLRDIEDGSVIEGLDERPLDKNVRREE